MKTVTLCIPQLIPLAYQLRDSSTVAQEKLAGPIVKLIKRLQCAQKTSTSDDYFAYLNMGEISQLPLAAYEIFSRDTTINTEHCYWYCDPVTIVADNSGIFLQGNAYMQISESESQQLLSDIQPLLAEHGATLHYQKPQRWILSAPSEVFNSGVPIETAVTKEIQAFTSSFDKKWQGLVTEIQMFLHQHEINQQRVAQGRAAINSLWLGNGGCLTKILAKLAWPLNKQVLYSNDSRIQGYAQYHDRQITSVPEQLSQLYSDNNDNLCIDTYLANQWYQADAMNLLSHVEQSLYAVNQLIKQLPWQSQLVLYLGGRVAYRLRKWDLLCFWH